MEWVNIMAIHERLTNQQCFQLIKFNKLRNYRAHEILNSKSIFHCAKLKRWNKSGPLVFLWITS